MKKSQIIALILFTIVLFSNCKKEDNSWNPCAECNLNAWVGSYEGTGVYYQERDSSSVLDVPTEVIIENTYDQRLKISVIAGKLFSSTTNVNKTDSNGFIEIAGSSSSLSLTLTQKDNDYRLSGTSKRYHYQGDTLLIIDYSLSFEVLKLME